MIKGARLRKLRIEKGMNQQMLADMVGVSKSSISCYEKETRSPKSETIIDFIQIFGVNADYLLGSDTIIKVVEDKDRPFRALTKEEIIFLEELKKNEMIYEILLEDPKKCAELIKRKIG